MIRIFEVDDNLGWSYGGHWFMKFAVFTGRQDRVPVWSLFTHSLLEGSTPRGRFKEDVYKDRLIPELTERMAIELVVRPGVEDLSFTISCEGRLPSLPELWEE
eukprot:gene8665-2901_t